MNQPTCTLCSGTYLDEEYPIGQASKETIRKDKETSEKGRQEESKRIIGTEMASRRKLNEGNTILGIDTESAPCIE